jgi:hypothetical protein
MSKSNDLKKIKIGVYQLQASTNSAKFKDKGYVKYGKNFNDDVIELTFLDKNKIKFILENDRIKYNDEIYFQFYKDNVSSSYFTKTSKVPVFHCSIMYNKQIIMTNLMNIYLYFNIDDTKSYKSLEQLTTSNLKGSYELIIEYNNKREQLPFEKFTTYEDLVNDIVELLSSDLLKVMIDEELDRQDEERIKKYGKADDYVLPDKTISFNDLVKKYEESNGNMDEIMEIYK